MLEAYSLGTPEETESRAREEEAEAERNIMAGDLAIRISLSISYPLSLVSCRLHHLLHPPLRLCFLRRFEFPSDGWNMPALGLKRFSVELVYDGICGECAGIYWYIIVYDNI